MFRKIGDFEASWTQESEATLRILRALTDASLRQAVTPLDRNLGRMAWHLVQSIPEMMLRTGFAVGGPPEEMPVPASAAVIADAYAGTSASLLATIKKSWTDASLEAEDDMYGQMWKRGLTLAVLINHQTHHRAQMTVLMRQANLRVPGVYGPAREEWASMGAQPPPI
jgi:uncharacterized damage-inducible protein DinB